MKKPAWVKAPKAARYNESSLLALRLRQNTSRNCCLFCHLLCSVSIRLRLVHQHKKTRIRPQVRAQPACLSRRSLALRSRVVGKKTRAARRQNKIHPVARPLARHRASQHPTGARIPRIKRTCGWRKRPASAVNRTSWRGPPTRSSQAMRACWNWPI